MANEKAKTKEEEARETEVKYWVRKLNTLRDGVILEPIVDTPPDEQELTFYGLKVRTPNGDILHVWFAGDEELNFGGVPYIENPKLLEKYKTY